MTKQGVIEAAFRGLLLVLSICSVGATSAYLGTLTSFCQYMELTHQKNPNIVIGTCEVFAYKYGTGDDPGIPIAEGSLKFESKGSAYWVLVLSLAMFFYQIIALLQLYFKCGILNIKRACYYSTVTIFFIVDMLLMSVFSIGYFCGGISIALLSAVKWRSVITFYNNVKIFYTIYGEIADHITSGSIFHDCDAITGLSFLSLVFCIITIVYFFIAICILKWPTHGATHYEGEKLPS